MFVKKVTWEVGSSLLCSQYTSGWTRPWAPPKKNPGSAYANLLTTECWVALSALNLRKFAWQGVVTLKKLCGTYTWNFSFLYEGRFHRHFCLYTWYHVWYLQNLKNMWKTFLKNPFHLIWSSKLFMKYKLKLASTLDIFHHRFRHVKLFSALK